MTNTALKHLSLLAALLLLGCSSSGTPATGETDKGSGAEDTSASVPDLPRDTAVPIPDGAVCAPGTSSGCNPTNQTQVLRCADDGSGFIPVACTGPDGEQSACIDGRCTLCFPGAKRCRQNSDDVVERCDETGSAWKEDQRCTNSSVALACQQGACIKLCDIADKLFTNVGCDYFAVDLDNAFVSGGPNGFLDAQGAQFAVVVSNPDRLRSATVTISDAQGAVLEGTTGPLDLSPIPPNGLRIFNLPRRDVNGTEIDSLAYRIGADIPITAYQFNPLENEEVFSNDASLLLPENVLGKFYIVMTREQTFQSLRGYLTVIAVKPGATQVTVTVTAKTLASTKKDDTGQPLIPAMSKGDSRTFTLQQFDVLNIETNETGADLTGSVVLADRDVVVFGGSEASNAPNTNRCDLEKGVCEWELQSGTPLAEAKKCSSHDDCSAFITCCADHLEQQLFPVKTWGTRYLCAKSFDRNKELDSWRILAAEDGTLVQTFPKLAGVNIPILDRGQWYEFETREHFELKADKPILVGQFLEAEQAPGPNAPGIPTDGDAGTGDPAFILVVPVEQFRSDYVFLAPNKYDRDFVNIIAPVGAKVQLDDQLLGDALFEPITPEFHVARRQIEDGVHRVRADRPVSVVVYGYDRFVSYGYPGGLDLKNLNLVTIPNF